MLPGLLQLLHLLLLLGSSLSCLAAPRTLVLDKPMTPPDWALLQRELLRANTEACHAFYEKYFDERGYLRCVERWGGDDGPDDAIECLNHWPVLHALGAPDSILERYKSAWEGHLRQFTEAKTTDVPFARDGMYYREFPVMMDWIHNGEGLTVFNHQGLSDPDDPRFKKRVIRYAGFYTGDDPAAQNYDPEKKIIRSMFNGSRGPLLRKATAVDWAGDPIEIEGRFKPQHGERNYKEMLAHIKDYNDIVGDHPSNLSATTLALNAYMLTGENKYKDWLLEYVDAWVRRTRANGGIIPSNIGLDGTIGGECDGKWYGGVYGWGFSVTVPQTGELAHRTTVALGLIGFANAYFLTGEDRYLDAWRSTIDNINANAKIIDGRKMFPQKFGDDGWYAFGPAPYSTGASDLHYWSMENRDLKRLPELDLSWRAYLRGEDSGYPQRALQREFETIRGKVQAMRNDATTPDTRLADDPLPYNPATVGALVELMLGGMPPSNNGSILHCRLRYFDSDRRRAGLPDDVAVLVERLTADQVAVQFVNVSQTKTRKLWVQAGGYGEHQLVSLAHGETSVPLDGRAFRLTLKPGAGGRVAMKMRRYVNQPTLTFPWNRERANN